jgi:hypothetical protein
LHGDLPNVTEFSISSIRHGISLLGSDAYKRQRAAIRSRRIVIRDKDTWISHEKGPFATVKSGKGEGVV